MTSPAAIILRRERALARLDRTGSHEPVSVVPQGKPDPRECTLAALHPTAPQRRARLTLRRAIPTLPTLPTPEPAPASESLLALAQSIIAARGWDEAMVDVATTESHHDLIRSQWIILDGNPVHVLDLTSAQQKRLAMPEPWHVGKGKVADAMRAKQKKQRDARMSHIKALRAAAYERGRVDFDPRAQLSPFQGFHAQLGAKPAAPRERDIGTAYYRHANVRDMSSLPARQAIMFNIEHVAERSPVNIITDVMTVLRRSIASVKLWEFKA